MNNNIEYELYKLNERKQKNTILKENLKAQKETFKEDWRTYWNEYSALGKLWNGLTGQTSANATIKANEMNIANQNYWNQVMMEREDTAHQREMADLQAAGLNPWLTVGGSGAAANGLNAAQAEPADGSKMLQATTAMALLAITKLLGRTTSRTNTSYIFRK